MGRNFNKTQFAGAQGRTDPISELDERGPATVAMGIV
jgi:hypothetical protein